MSAILILLILSIPITSAAVSSQDLIETCFEGPPPVCALMGVPDLYGTGVRVGIYSSWMASLFANTFLLDEISSALDTNAMFLFAISVAVGSASAERNIRIIDALILLQMAFGFLLSVMTIWGYRTRVYWDKTDDCRQRQEFGGWGTHLRLILVTAISIYGVWFWVYGMPQFLPRCDTRRDCGGLVIWLLGYRRLEDRSVVYFYRSLSVLFSVYYGVMLLMAVLGAFRLMWDLAAKHEDRFRWQLQETVMLREPWPPGGNARIWQGILFGGNVLWTAGSIAAIECTLIANNIQRDSFQKTMSSPGQLIPLLIGACVLARVLFLWALDTFYRNDVFSSESSETSSRVSSEDSVHMSTVVIVKQRPIILPYKGAGYRRIALIYLPWLLVFRRDPYRER